MIHRYWTGPTLPPLYARQFKKMAEAHDEVRDWTDADLPPDMIRFADEHFDLVPDTGWLRAKHRSNMIRLLLLQRFGGTWIDHDVALLQLPAGEFISGYDADTPCSAVISLPMHHPLLDEALAAIAPARLCMEAAGERMLARTWGARIAVRPFPHTMEGELLPGIDHWAIHLFHSATTTAHRRNLPPEQRR